MSNKSKTIFSLANIALQNNQFESAISLYEEAILDASEPLRSQIKFNYKLAHRKARRFNVNFLKVKSETELDIPVVKFDDTEECYHEYKNQNSIDPLVKLIAFYLPQFHPIPENDKWWGKGFTEWSNVGKALPNYTGHYQPHCPTHFGYYDLRVQGVMEEQAALAKEYGIFGFSYYYYWFAGQTLLEGPLLSMLENKKVDMPFCLTWANENWTRRWDGQDNDILMGQEHSPEDSLAFIRNIIKYFKDSRYIRIHNKPLLIIYRANIIPEIQSTVALWRQEILKFGFDGLYLVAAQTFGIKSPDPYGFDASVEFPPHTVQSADIRHELDLINSDFKGHIFSYEQCVNNAVRYKEPEYKVFRTAMLSWDNTARKQNAGHVFHGFSLLRYKQWLNSLCAHVNSSAKYDKDEKLVFINAWNEWAEGTHLEPDRKYGYAYLKSTYDVVKNYDRSILSCTAVQNIVKKNKTAVILHVHYVELWKYIVKYLRNFGSLEFDLYVTTTNSNLICVIKKEYPDSYVIFVENRGRDVLPFIEILRKIHGLNYDAICKLHTKRSDYRSDGAQLRDMLFNSLLGSREKIDLIIAKLTQDSSIGIIVPESFLIKHTDHNMTFDRDIVQELSEIMSINFEYSVFPAGSMFWFRQSALSRLLYLDGSFFPAESGLADGTPAHAVERLFCIAAISIGYKVVPI